MHALAELQQVFGMWSGYSIAMVVQACDLRCPDALVDLQQYLTHLQRVLMLWPIYRTCLVFVGEVDCC